jgi:hypothetical protein
MNNTTLRKTIVMPREKVKTIIFAVILTLLGFFTAYFLLSSGILRFDFL